MDHLFRMVEIYTHFRPCHSLEIMILCVSCIHSCFMRTRKKQWSKIGTWFYWFRSLVLGNMLSLEIRCLILGVCTDDFFTQLYRLEYCSVHANRCNYTHFSILEYEFWVWRCSRTKSRIPFQRWWVIDNPPLPSKSGSAAWQLLWHHPLKLLCSSVALLALEI